ncbi:MAG: biotin--[acetyl-CoA-carboxylase] ligase [Deltaproteobacteria bacterium]|nr:biotin--[acetyl-CoA-carboxylase] ligase [Deltaproteobacteria bacterium]
MARIDNLLNLLSEQKNYLSSFELSKKLKISPHTIIKTIGLLRRCGYTIETKRRVGYRLIQKPDKLYPWEVRFHLVTRKIGYRIIYKQVLESTNTYAIELAKKGEPEGTCVVSEAQKKGKGRLGRKWISPEGKNIYLSIILRPQISFSDVHTLSYLTCLVVTETLETVSTLRPTLKWPNDVLIGEKKISGTLVELSSTLKKVNFVVVGIGLNVNMEPNDLPEEIKNVATSIYMETGRKYDRAYVCAILLNSFEKFYLAFLEKGSSFIRTIWEEKAKIKGQALTVSVGENIVAGLCEGLGDDGALLLNTPSGTERIYAGDLVV